MPIVRVYWDTSVFGGAFDEEFRMASLAFFDSVRRGMVDLVISSALSDEIQDAPAHVRKFFSAMRPFLTISKITPQAIDLQQAYIRARVVSPKWDLDALHVAMATVSGCGIIVSWNFGHIVNFRRIPLYNGGEFEPGIWTYRNSHASEGDGR